MDGLINIGINRLTGRQTEIWMDGWMDGWMDKWMDE